jgi:hypothetical protein
MTMNLETDIQTAGTPPVGSGDLLGIAINDIQIYDN